MAKIRDINLIRRGMIEGKMARYGLDNELMSTKMRVSQSTWNKFKNDTGTLDLKQVERLGEILHFDSEETWLFVTGIAFDSIFGEKARRLGLNNLIARG